VAATGIDGYYRIATSYSGTIRRSGCGFINTETSINLLVSQLSDQSQKAALNITKEPNGDVNCIKPEFMF
jgi:hypothetical protein